MKIIGLDVGEKRIGIARADSSTRIAVPVGFIEVNGTEWDEIMKLSRLHSTNYFVVGLPRSNEGNETAQSMYVRQFAKTLVEKIPEAKVRFQDESLTSVEAEERLRSRRRVYEKGEIDAEAATIILQDFLEGFTASSNASNVASNDEPPAAESNPGIKATLSEVKENATLLTKKEAEKMKLNSQKAKSKVKKVAGIVVLIVMLLLIGGGVGGFLWAKSSLGPVTANCGDTCEEVKFTVTDGESKAMIADNLMESGLIKNAFVFKTYMQLFRPDVNLKSGTYTLNKGLSADEIIEKLAKGVVDQNTFTFTILPGETIYDIKAKLIELKYLPEDIEAAFKANYDFDFLQERPEGATLEGYLFGETHEFYSDATVEEILETFLKGTQEVLETNQLRTKYAERGLSLFEGITLASIVQKEASAPEQATVAQVFLSRLNAGIPLGSDVTVSYALDTVDPDRQTYSDNAAALTVDSCYNTRTNAGLPCGPISNPGLSALLAVASPSDTSYLYFLTGDDGMMYYSNTESEHNQNIIDHCQELCNVSL